MKMYRQGKTPIVRKLREYHGYSERRAIKIVNQVIQCIKDALVEGKDVEIEGLGTLKVVKRKEQRVCIPYAPGGPKTYLTRNRKKTVELKLTAKEVNKWQEAACARTRSPETPA